MSKYKTAIVLTMIALVLMYSCNFDSIPGEEVEKIAAVGGSATTKIMDEYQEKGSYSGVTTISYNDSVCIHFTNAKVSVDLSAIDPTMGTHNITINGEILYSYDALPATFPFSMACNLKYDFAGKTHTLVLKGIFKDVSTYEFTLLKVDGKSYNPSTLNNLQF